MEETKCLVLAQNRQGSEYNDFIGKYYHFPKKYKKILSQSGLEFVYYEPPKKGKGVYFGHGKIGKVFADKKEAEHYFAEILEYKPFTEGVPLKNSNGDVRESGPGYNPRNSVRIITHEILDGICLDGGILLSFNADAHLIKVLGEELIASEVVGVLELVKNAYDANASVCKVRIENIPNLLPFNRDEYTYQELQGPVIVIEDDGVGMNRETIENGWLRPASTIKTESKDLLKLQKEKAAREGKLKVYESLVSELKKKYGGRIPLGEKGVGRFATHRLGRSVIIKTKTKDVDYEYILKIDWDKFENHEDRHVDLDEIGFGLYRQKPSRNYGKRNSGTQIIIYGGRTNYELTKDRIAEINRSLLKLKSPSSGKAPKSFEVLFECPQVVDLEQSIEQEFNAIFSLDALVDENGKAEITLDFTPPKSVPLPDETIEKNNYDLRQLNNHYWADNTDVRKPRCGPFFLHIDIWYRAKPWIDGLHIKEFTKYLDNFGGISIFRDGLNVFPAEWGAQVDWLTLSKRHIKKGKNLSYYNMIGNLEIEQTKNLELIDKTDRQGLLDNAAFRDLQDLVRTIVRTAEIEFIGKREKYEQLTKGLIREPRVLGSAAQKGALLVDNIIKRYDVAEDALEILSDFGKSNEREENLVNLKDSLKNLRKSLDVMQGVQDTLTEQAGFGLAIAVSVHEIAKITSNFYNGVTHLLKSGKIDTEKLEELQSSSRSLNTEMKRFGPLRAIRNEKPTKFPILKCIRFCKRVFENKLSEAQIELLVLSKSKVKVFARYGAVNQVISNLIDNSVYWLDDKHIKERVILIKIFENERRILIADSGPDIDSSIRPYLFEPGYSLKVPQSGLGLYICKYYMRGMGGDIYEASVRDRTHELHGAQFILDFSRVKEGG
ncbi:MAG: ATP-binding protein [Planctomycetes bacterium B3_Pla]|nr:MAG: ATP-binding protein [Planctomycetes bacterium B3_Pla]